ncbi:MAG: AAA family ATPase [Clostridiaceae bacterium]|nr:AAA family ATPase [Clostridiaceae bacterium]
MARLNLVIADMDEAYTESIVNYLMASHSQRFQVSSFTKKELLYDFLVNDSKKTDILLICPEFYCDSLPKDKITSIIFLAVGRLSEDVSDCGVVNKYQHGEKLINEVLNLFSEKCKNISLNSTGSKVTKAVAVYSPVGGSGKTTLSTCMAKQCAKQGLQVFYLNFESMQSTTFFMDSKGGQSLSEILFYLKGKNKNLQLKIEGTRLTDKESNVHFFLPPDSMFELEEVEPEEIKKLISELKAMGQYDIIFVDMSSELSKRNLAIMEACDEIILVFPQDAVACVKADIFEKELGILSKRNNIDISDKITIVLNKYNSHMALEIDTVSIVDESISHYIPIVPAMISIKGNVDFTEIFTEFSSSIQDLISKYFE